MSGPATTVVVVRLGDGSVSAASLEIHLPPSHPSSPPSARFPVVLVVPGGSYRWLNVEKEGGPPAAWLAAELGVVACVLRYRLPPAHPWPAARDDLNLAMAFVLSADARRDLLVDATRLGILGFSAGAHLAMQQAPALVSGVIKAAVLVYPPATDGPGVDTLAALQTECAAASTPDPGCPAAAAAAHRETPQAHQFPPPQTHQLPACYVVASTVDRVCPPGEHADLIAAGLTQLGAGVTYQKQRLGAHGFGCVAKWTQKAGPWLRSELIGDPPRDDRLAPIDTTDVRGTDSTSADNPDEAVLAAFRRIYAGLGATERSEQPVSVRGRIVARRQGRAPRVFLDLQSGAQRLQLVIELDTDGTGAIVPLASAVTPGAVVTAIGHPGRMPGRGALALFVPPSNIAVLPSSELPDRLPFLPPSKPAPNSAVARFHMSPGTTGWQTSLGKLYIGAHNSLTWTGDLPLPAPPAATPATLAAAGVDGADSKGCWLLPATDVVALAIAWHHAELRGLGWRVLTCAAPLIARLSNKVAFRDHASALGLLRHLPEHYACPAVAKFPCVMKGAEGNHGQNVKVIPTRELLELKSEIDWADGRALLQELIPGRVEHACSVLVTEGKIIDAVDTEYTYDKDEYVWPFVKEEKDKRVSHDRIPDPHLAVMTALLAGYSGVANFNFKVRPSGEIAIFEVNTRVGGDLAEDVPRWRARTFLEKLDAVELLPM